VSSIDVDEDEDWAPEINATVSAIGAPSVDRSALPGAFWAWRVYALKGL